MGCYQGVGKVIVVIEGISASGKSTWCNAHGADHTIPETGPVQNVPCEQSDPQGAAAYWAGRNVLRWQTALAMEQRTGLALCDTDPLKLHYTWCLWQIGEVTEQQWQLSVQAVRATIEGRKIGFADAYFVKTIDPDLARAQARVDMTRRRQKLDLHVRLQPALLKWYEVLDKVLPDRVQFGFPDELPTMHELNRYPGLAVFDDLIAALPA